jgi:hypothetical protein
MSWTETFHCDVCSKAKSEGSGDWWLAWLGTTAGEPGAQDESMLKMTGWNQVLSHSVRCPLCADSYGPLDANRAKLIPSQAGPFRRTPQSFTAIPVNILSAPLQVTAQCDNSY